MKEPGSTEASFKLDIPDFLEDETPKHEQDAILFEEGRKATEQFQRDNQLVDMDMANLSDAAKKHLACLFLGLPILDSETEEE
jgi:hypothetical protein